MMTSQYLLSKSYLDVVLVGVEAAAMPVSALLQLGEVLQEAWLRVLRHPCEGGGAANQDDSLAGVDGTAVTTI